MSRTRRLLKWVIIGFFINKGSERNVGQLATKIKQSFAECSSEVQELSREIADSGTYLTHTKKSNLLSRIESLRCMLATCEKKIILPSELANSVHAVLEESEDLAGNYNQQFVRQRKRDYRYLWVKGSICLDDDQQTAIVTDDKYNLVIAAAGSGKTEVLTTRIAYLIQRKPDCIEPKRILAIAFQRKASHQITDRLLQRYGIENVNVATFHKLGKDILERLGHEIRTTDIVDENKKYGFIKSFVEEQVAINPVFFKLFIRYMKTVNDNEERIKQSDKEKATAYLKEQKYITINRKKVNSVAEKAIMDYFLTHKIDGKPIEVEYERELEDFKPDFYLPQLDIFIEHWALDKEGNVPDWFNQTSQEYREIKEKKKTWFREHNQILVETYSYEFDPKEPDLFCEILRKRIEAATQKSLLFTPLAYSEVLDLVWESQKTPVEDIKNFITTAKTYGYNPDAIARRLIENKWSSKQFAFGSLALEVFRAYEFKLDSLRKVDFEDMINEATAELERNPDLCKDMYDHILVDEYQDISTQRLNLIRKLLERNPNCKLFCVGDDWQSIMGFSGSNLSFFGDFKFYFENPAVTHISTNYRSIKSIVDTGAELIKNNGNKQVQKLVNSNNKTEKPILVLESPHKAGYDNNYFRQTVDDCLNRINEYLSKGYSPDDILVLSRFMRTKVFGRYRWFRVVETFSYLAKERGINVAIDNEKLPNAIQLLTVHRSKGLEAKVVFILNVVRGEFGFPSEIQDPSILDVATGENGINDPVEEERRLFYVAVTRAKEDLFIYTRSNEQSKFLNEIAFHTTPLRLSY
jgi:DNA helicase IV